jgi:hypothetical protein
MLLSEASLPMQYDDCKSVALVYPYEVAAILYEVQQQHGDPRHVPAGRQLTDGRWMLCGDVLSEVGEHGILSKAFGYITTEMMANVEVIPMSEALALLPLDQPTP